MSIIVLCPILCLLSAQNRIPFTNFLLLIVSCVRRPLLEQGCAVEFLSPPIVNFQLECVKLYSTCSGDLADPCLTDIIAGYRQCHLCHGPQQCKCTIKTIFIFFGLTYNKRELSRQQFYIILCMCSIPYISLKRTICMYGPAFLLHINLSKSVENSFILCVKYSGAFLYH